MRKLLGEPLNLAIGVCIVIMLTMLGFASFHIMTASAFRNLNQPVAQIVPVAHDSTQYWKAKHDSLQKVWNKARKKFFLNDDKTPHKTQP